MNPYFQAQTLWEAGQQREAVRYLNTYLLETIGADAFPIGTDALDVDPRDFQRGFYSVILFLLSDGHESNLSVPFCRVFPHLWRWNQSSFLLRILKSRDIFAIPSTIEIMQEEGILSEEEFATTEKDIDLLVDGLLLSASRGILSPEPHEHPQSGRVAFPIQEVAAIPDQQWGILKDKLLAQLPNAYAACPPNFWQHLAAEDPQQLVTHFLHHSFRIRPYPLETVALHIRWTVHRAPQYTQALIVAVDRLLTSAPPERLTEFAQVDAGVVRTTNGVTWFTHLRDALHSGDLESWQAYMAQLWGPAGH